MISIIIPIILTIIAIIYLFSPIDLLPDVAPPFTYIDDLFLIIVAGISWLVYLGQSFILTATASSTASIITIIALSIVLIAVFNYVKNKNR